MTDLVQITQSLSDAVGALSFSEPVQFVYNPLEYASELHHQYLRRFGSKTGRAVWLGMNPGPWGMAQTGVPFGEISAVKDWMGLSGEVEQPPAVHPKRPVLGLNQTRSEVSGRRLWGWAQEHFGEADRFFEHYFVINYCPLIFLEASGKNRVPEKLPASERKELFSICDSHLKQMIEVLKPSAIIGVGVFAEKCAKRIVQGEVKVGRVLHPSPASPAANRGWAEAAEKQLRDQHLLASR